MTVVGAPTGGRLTPPLSEERGPLSLGPWKIVQRKFPINKTASKERIYGLPPSLHSKGVASSTETCVRHRRHRSGGVVRGFRRRGCRSR